LRHGILEAAADAVQRDAGVAPRVRRDRRDGLLQLIETCAPITQLALHDIDARRGLYLVQALVELALERLASSR
jgi:hypothetical protein